MDIGMPHMNGVEAIRRIHSEFPNIRIIGLSLFDEEIQAAAMIEAGASAYVPKSQKTDLLLSAIWGEKYTVRSLVLKRLQPARECEIHFWFFWIRNPSYF